MCYDKIISSIQKRAVAFSFLSRKPSWAVLLRERKKETRERSKKWRRNRRGRRKKEGEKEYGKKRATVRFTRRIMTLLRRTPMHMHLLRRATGEGLCSVRKRPATLYTFISWTLLFDERKKRKEKDEVERACSIVSSRLVSSLIRDNRRRFS